MKIFYVDRYKIRPFVAIKCTKDGIIGYPVTCRMRQGKHCVPLNNYKIYGICNTEQEIFVPKKNIRSFVRKCTKTEEEAILQSKR